MKELTFGGKLSCQDFLQFNKYNFKDAYIKTFIVQLGAYMMIAMITLDKILVSILSISISLMISIGLSFVTTFILKGIRIKNLEDIYKSSTKIKNEKVYKTTEEGLLCKGEKNETLVKWKDMFQVDEKPDMLLLYTTPIQATVIPKSFFEDEITINEFKEILKEKVSANRIKLVG